MRCWGAALRREEVLERYYLRHLVEPVAIEELLVDLLTYRKDSNEQRARLKACVEDFLHADTR